MNNAFIDILRQIIHPNTYQNKQRIETIIARISKKKSISERDWLREKILALQKELPNKKR